MLYIGFAHMFYVKQNINMQVDIETVKLVYSKLKWKRKEKAFNFLSSKE